MSERRLEQTTEILDKVRDSEVAKVRALVPPQRNSNADGECTRCGDLVPAARLRLGYDYCIFCAELSERKS